MAEIKNLEIDIESFSDVDLTKCGVYKYASAPDFEVILFAYSVDGGPVRQIDIACGEKIPAEIIAALEDNTVTKWAFNANFERVCLSRYLGYPTGDYLMPDSWRCSMVWAAYLGLPLSLEGVGTVLGLEKQKLTEGKNLIKYFCQPCAPTKSNGGRTRNLPADAPEKWQAFKTYNIRDVEVEMAIQARLSNYPVPESVWEEYHLDQEINDRGIMIDRELVAQALLIDARSKSDLMTRLQAMTGLDNPNSVQQLKGYLADRGIEADSLGKKEVAAMIKTVPGNIAEVLSLRLQLAKSSVSGANFTCSDTATARTVAKRTYEAAVELFAYLCKQYNLNPIADGVIISHREGHSRGIASNHGDPEHLWNGLGMGYTMDGFRKAVKAAMDGSGVSEPEEGGWYRVRKSWADAKSQKGAFKVLANAKKCADENPGYSVYDESGKAVYGSQGSGNGFSPYLVQVSITDLNIRKGPGTNYGKTGKYTGKGVFTIVEEASGQGASCWGKLKSGAGWISLDYAKKI